MDIIELLKTAKIGRERKEAQIDTCAPFAAALYDVLFENGFDVNLFVVAYRGATVDSTWYHLVVEHDGIYYDSLGEFSTDIMRTRLKVRSSTQYELTFKREPRPGCYEEEDYAVLYDFLLDEFRRAARKLKASSANTLSAHRL